MESFPNSPFEFGNDDCQPPIGDPNVTPSDNQFFNQESMQNGPFMTFERSNDFDSSAGIFNQRPQPMNHQMMNHDLYSPQTTEERKQNISRMTNKGPPVQLSPNPVVLSPNSMVLSQNMPKSTDFKIEPEKFSIKAKKGSQLKETFGMTPKQKLFIQFCQDQNNRIFPKQLGFIPSEYWTDQEYSFGQIVEHFFMRKGDTKARFPIKVYNALQIVNHYPGLIPLIGIQWVNDYVLKLDTDAFAMLLNIKAVNGGLIHSQGNFPSHGFVVIQSHEDALMHVSEDIAGSVNYNNTFLLYHKERMFTRSSTESDIEKLHWTSVKERK